MSFFKRLSLVSLLFLFFIFASCSNASLKDKIVVNKKMVENTDLGNIAQFETSLGNFKVELFLDRSPITAGNFKKLVEEGFYDGTRFHRIIKDFMIQGGDPQSKNLSLANKWGTGGSGRVIADEFVDGLSNVRGTLSMANSGPNSGSSQFFINVVNNTFLDWNKQPAQSKHPVFGKIISGMDVVDKIVNMPTMSGDRPRDDVLIKKASIIN